MNQNSIFYSKDKLHKLKPILPTKFNQLKAYRKLSLWEKTTAWCTKV